MSEGVQSAVKSADRVLDLFELLAHAGREMSHTEIAATLQIPKSSLSQLLKNLINRGYVEVSSNGKSYRVGNTLVDLSQTAGRVRDLASLSKDFLSTLTSETGESSALNQLRGDNVEVVATHLGPHRLVTHMRLGDIAPMYATSAGKIILAHMPASFQTEYLERVTFDPVTPKTIKSVRTLQKQLKDTRDTGFGYSFEEWTPGIVGIAVPVFDGHGRMLGALNVAMPASRFDDAHRKRIEQALTNAADGLRRYLSGGASLPSISIRGH